VIILRIIPAIDLYKGKVVRLIRGNPETSQIYSEDPIGTAKEWKTQGAKALHVVDLDSALGTGLNNVGMIMKIANSIDIPIQVGGGIRTFDDASMLLNGGVERLVLGTLAFKETLNLKKLVKTFGKERIIVALDYVGEDIMVKGWTSSTGLSIQEAITRFKNLGSEIFLLTAVERDGTLTGPDYLTLRKIMKTFKIKILASGGISSIHDLIHLKEIGIYGVIVGKALYESKFSLKHAISTIRRI
jgi:phosphoribosylformimino-5-aminoimidazole carboxamide ribotide isomerase